MSYNLLTENGPATATALASSNTIYTVNMSYNFLAENGPATATALASSNTIHTVDMSHNGLREHGPATATALASSNTIYTVNMAINNLYKHEAAIKKIFDNYNSDMKNEIHDYIQEPGNYPDNVDIPDMLTNLIGEYLGDPIDLTL